MKEIVQNLAYQSGCFFGYQMDHKNRYIRFIGFEKQLETSVVYIKIDEPVHVMLPLDNKLGFEVQQNVTDFEPYRAKAQLLEYQNGKIIGQSRIFMCELKPHIEDQTEAQTPDAQYFYNEMKELADDLEQKKESDYWRGPQGEQGPSGHTPVKGVDYFTPQEINEFVDKAKYDDTDVKKDIFDLQNEDTNIKKRIDNIETSRIPNVTIVGQPTIKGSQMSGFSPTNYATFPFLMDLKYPFEIKFAMTTGNDVVSQQNILDSDFGLAFAVRNRRFVIALSTNGTSWNLGEGVGTLVIDPNTSYLVKISWDGNAYSVSYSLNGGNTYTLDIIKVSNESLAPKQMYIGVGESGATIMNSFGGIIDFEYASLIMNGSTIWLGYDDIGLLTRMSTNMSNIDESGIAKVKEIVSDDIKVVSDRVDGLETDVAELNETLVDTNTRLDTEISDRKTSVESVESKLDKYVEKAIAHDNVQDADIENLKAIAMKKDWRLEVDDRRLRVKQVPKGAMPNAKLTKLGGLINKNMDKTREVKVFGDSRKWNQLFKSLKGTYNGIVFTSYDNNAESLNGTLIGTNTRAGSNMNCYENHYYYTKPYGSALSKIDRVQATYTSFRPSTVGNDKCIYKCDKNLENTYIQIYAQDGAQFNDDVLGCVIADLTTIFGQGNEPTDVNDERIKQIEAYAEAHPEYDGGSIQNVVFDEEVISGANIWDEEWEVGVYDTSTGLKKDNQGTIRSKYFIPVEPNTEYYYFYGKSSSFFNICYYDINKNFISALTWDSVTVNKVNITPNNCRYVAFNTPGNYGNIYTNDIAIIKGTSGSYSPYTGQTITYPNNVVLNGINDIKDEIYSYVEGDELVTKKITRYGEVDLGSLNWTYNSSWRAFYSKNILNSKSSSDLEGCELITSRYIKTRAHTTSDNVEDKSVNLNSSAHDANTITIRDLSFTDATLFKQSLQGQNLIYELATPTIEEILRIPLSMNIEKVENVSTNNTSYAQESSEMVKGVLEVGMVDELNIRGANIWDEEYISSGYITNSGVVQTGYGNLFSSKNKIPVNGNSEYLFLAPYNINDYGVRVAFYSDYNTLINVDDYYSYKILTPKNAKYIMFCVNGIYGSSEYKNNVAIIKGTSGTYKPYMTPFINPLPQAIRSLDGYGWGINDAVNEVDFEPTTYHNMKSVDLGELEWTRVYLPGFGSISYYFKTTDIKDMVEPVNTSTRVNALCELFTPHEAYANTLLNTNNTMSLYEGVFAITCTRFTDAQSFKQAMKGVILHYEAVEGGEDYEAMLYHKRVDRDDMGKLTWYKQESTGIIPQRFQANVPTMIGGSDSSKGILCSKYNSSLVTEQGNMFRYSGRIYVYDNSYNDATLFKQAMNGVMLYYELAQEQIYDITSLLSEDFNILKVESGGEIEMHIENDYEFDVPNTEAYLIDVEEAVSNE